MTLPLSPFFRGRRQGRQPLIYIYIYITHANAYFIRDWSFCANKQYIFAALSRTAYLFFAEEPMLNNSSSCKDSFITCQITSNYHGELLHSLANMQLGCCWLGNFLCKAYWATPFKMQFDFRLLLRRTFAKTPLSANPSHQQEPHQRKSKHQAHGSRKAPLLEAWLLHARFGRSILGTFWWALVDFCFFKCPNTGIYGSLPNHVIFPQFFSPEVFL